MALFKLNYFELALGMVLKFYTSIAKRLKLKVKKFLRVIFMFVEVTGEKLIGEEEGFFTRPFPLSPILYRLRVLTQIKLSVQHCKF